MITCAAKLRGRLATQFVVNVGQVGRAEGRVEMPKSRAERLPEMVELTALRAGRDKTSGAVPRPKMSPCKQQATTPRHISPQPAISRHNSNLARTNVRRRRVNSSISYVSNRERSAVWSGEQRVFVRRNARVCGWTSNLCRYGDGLAWALADNRQRSVMRHSEPQ
jgi:hypothetical protein